MKSIVFISHIAHSLINFIPLIKFINNNYPELNVKLIDLNNFFLPTKEIDKDIPVDLKVDVYKMTELLSNRSENNFLFWFKRFIIKEKPKAIILPLDWWIYSSIVDIATFIDTKTIILQESILDNSVLFPKINFINKIIDKIPILNKLNNQYFFGKKEKAIYCLTGNYYKNILKIYYPYMDKNYFVTGSLKMEYRFQEKKLSVHRVKKKLNLPCKAKFLLYVSQDFDNWSFYYRLKYPHRETLIETLLEIKALDPNIYHVVLAHPSENLNSWKNLISRFSIDSKKVIILQNPDIPYLSLYEAAYGLVGFFSTCLIEAMYVGKPIMTLDYIFEKPYLSVLQERQAVISIKEKTELSKMSKNFLLDDQCKKLFKNQFLLAQDIFGIQDGRCSQRVMEVINS